MEAFAEAYTECYDQLLKQDTVEPDRLGVGSSEAFSIIQDLEEEGYAERMEGRCYDVEGFDEEAHLDFIEAKGFLFSEVSQHEKEILVFLEEGEDGRKVEEIAEELDQPYSVTKEELHSLNDRSMVVPGPGMRYESAPFTV